MARRPACSRIRSIDRQRVCETRHESSHEKADKSASCPEAGRGLAESCPVG